MSLSMDLKIRGQYGSTPLNSGSTASVFSGGSSFAEVFSAASQVSGPSNYEDCFQAASEAYQVPVNLLKAVAKVESDFTANAVSCCGAQGVMQLMPATARYLGVTNAFDPAQNIMGGAKYLRQLLNRFSGDISKALAGYNAGPGAVEKAGGVPSYTQGYVNKVLGYMGVDLSVPTQAFSTGAAAENYGTGSDSDGSVTEGDLVEQVMDAYCSSGVSNQEAARLFLQRFLTPDEDEKDERYQAEPADDHYDLKKLAMQVDF